MLVSLEINIRAVNWLPQIGKYLLPTSNLTGVGIRFLQPNQTQPWGGYIILTTLTSVRWWLVGLDSLNEVSLENSYFISMVSSLYRTCCTSPKIVSSLSRLAALRLWLLNLFIHHQVLWIWLQCCSRRPCWGLSFSLNCCLWGWGENCIEPVLVRNS